MNVTRYNETTGEYDVVPPEVFGMETQRAFRFELEDRRAGARVLAWVIYFLIVVGMVIVVQEIRG